MIPTMILFGAIFGRWWSITLAVAAFGWPVLLVATDVVAVNSGLIEAGVLAVANAGVGVLLHQGLLYAYRRLRQNASSEVAP
ncbi:MAG TPA: hypothetical protein VFR87_01210 [Nocardioidaceae bacterium]|nr:hypothetical protein [Nocardioidaceae bacterium]